MPVGKAVRNQILALRIAAARVRLIHTMGIVNGYVKTVFPKYSEENKDCQRYGQHHYQKNNFYSLIHNVYI